MAADTDFGALRTSLLKLTCAQQAAVEALIAGATHQEASAAAGVTRATVTRWSGHSPAFKAALNLYRVALLNEQFDTARRIRGKALNGVEKALDEGRIDPLAVLRILTEDPTSIGPTVPDAILEAEVTKTYAALPPSPPPRGLEEQLASLADAGPSGVERATKATLTRLAAEGLVDDEAELARRRVSRPPPSEISMDSRSDSSTSAQSVETRRRSSAD